MAQDFSKCRRQNGPNVRIGIAIGDGGRVKEKEIPRPAGKSFRFDGIQRARPAVALVVLSALPAAESSFSHAAVLREGHGSNTGQLCFQLYLAPLNGLTFYPLARLSLKACLKHSTEKE